jgi:hypothetical protein
MKLGIVATQNSIHTLLSIAECIDNASVTADVWPGPLWIEWQDTDTDIVRALITEAGLIIYNP